MTTAPFPLRALAVSALGVAALTLAGCSPASSGDDPEALVVSAAFYPLEYAASAVAGEHATVRTITAPGVEPHDLELSPAAVRELGQSDVIVYVAGFQPAVDDAVANLPADVTVIDVTEHIELLPAGAGTHGHEEEGHEEEGHEDDGHEEEGHEDEEEGHDDHGDLDPHFWLDPQTFAELAPVLAQAFAAVDPANSAAFEAGAEALTRDLEDLDQSFSSALASCDSDVIVVSHEAFGYLAHAYDLEQVGLSGISPDAEPSPARLRDVREVVEHEGVSTIFFETLVSSQVSQTFASDLGVATAVLDPVEGLVNEDDDYRSVMERNRDALVDGLGCR